MNRFVKFLILTLVVTAAVMTTGTLSETAAQDKEQPPSGKFYGVPRDIDFIKNLGFFWSPSA
jgi:hypothetical protein